MYVICPLLFLLVFTVVFLGYHNYKAHKDEAKSELERLSKRISLQVELQYDKGVEITKTMALAEANRLFGMREASLEYARQVLIHSPDFSGIYLAYEPNADGQDEAYLGTDDEAMSYAIDEQGRFLPYWYVNRISQDTIELEPLIDVDTSDYYRNLKQQFLANGTVGPLLTEPFRYQGNTIIEQTYPIIIDGSFKGVVGVDKAIENLDAFLQKLKEENDVDIYILSTGKRFLALTTPQFGELITQELVETPYASIFQSLYQFSDTGAVYLDVDPYTKQESYYSCGFVNGANWMVIVKISREKVLAPIYASLVPTIAVTVVGVVLVILLVIVYWRSFSRRIDRSAVAADRLAQGDYTQDFEVNEKRLDEIGFFFQSLNSTVSQIQERELRIRESEQRYRVLIESSNTGAWEFDAESRFFWCSSHYFRMMGIEADDYRSDKGYDIENVFYKRIHAEDFKRVYEAFGDYISQKSGELFEAVFRMQHANGEWVWVWSRSRALVDNNDEVTPVLIGTLIDITRQKHAEEALRTLNEELEAQVVERTEQYRQAKEIAEKATKAKSDFLARMSHEIRTPMNAVLGLSNLALKTNLDRHQRNYLSIVNQSSVSLLGIINDILDFSKIEAGELELEYAQFSLESLMEDVVNVMAYRAHEKGLELVLDMKSVVPDQVIGDSLRLRQILVNLLSNAVKFTERGEVVLSVEQKSRQGREIALQFKVRDTGCGIAREHLDKMFRPHPEIENKKTLEFIGSGLGLTICERLASMMGGTIEVESEPGKGSEFSVSLNFRIDPNAEQITWQVHESLKGLKLLLCDDVKSSRYALVSELEAFGFDVHPASSGFAAIDYLEKNSSEPVALILLDTDMPLLNGFETARKIKANPAISTDIPIIMLSANEQDEYLKEADSTPLVKLSLVKPISRKELFNGIMEALDRREFLRKKTHRFTRFSEAQLSTIKGARILLVEDNEVNQQVAKEVIELIGCRVDLANDGAEAVETIAKHADRYELVFMDLQMPVMDGYSATIEIRKNEAYDKIPIVAMTADALVGVRDRCLDIGMNGYISKPIDPDSVFEVMLQLIEARDRHVEQAAMLQPEADTIEFPDFEHIDIEDGLQRLNYMKPIYSRVLVRFSENQNAFMSKINDAYAQGDIETVKRMVHTLKGISGNLGAKGLHQKCIEFEQAMETDMSRFEQLIGVFETIFLAVLSETQAYAKSLK